MTDGHESNPLLDAISFIKSSAEKMEQGLLLVFEKKDGVMVDQTGKAIKQAHSVVENLVDAFKNIKI